MPRWPMWTWAMLAISLVLAPNALAQLPEPGAPAPPVTFEDRTIASPVAPGNGAALVQLTTEIGCSADELLLASTTARFEAGPVPGWARLSFSPEQHVLDPGPCSQDDATREVTTMLAVSVEQAAPAFQQADLPVHLFLAKDYPQDHLDTTYGPYVANVTLEPGYLAELDVLVESEVVTVPAGSEARYTLTVLNQANGESQATLEPASTNLDGVEVRIEPSQLVLHPGSQGTVVVVVEDAREQGTGASVASEVLVTLSSLDARGESTGSELVELRTQLDGPQPSTQARTPGPSVLAVLVGVSLTSLFLSRLRSR